MSSAVIGTPSGPGSKSSAVIGFGVEDFAVDHGNGRTIDSHLDLGGVGHGRIQEQPGESAVIGRDNRGRELFAGERGVEIVRVERGGEDRFWENDFWADGHAYFTRARRWFREDGPGPGGDGDAEDGVGEHIDIGLVDVAVAVDIGVAAEFDGQDARCTGRRDAWVTLPGVDVVDE